MSAWEEMAAQATALWNSAEEDATVAEAEAIYARAALMRRDAALLALMEAEQLAARAMHAARAVDMLEDTGSDDIEFALRTVTAAAVKQAEEWGRERKRRAIPRDVRVTVFRRDGYQCVECGEGEPTLLTLDHRHPIKLGGSDEPENLRTLCRRCNSAKGGRL